MEQAEEFAELHCDSSGRVHEFMFGGVNVTVNSVDEARDMVRRHAVKTSKPVVITTTTDEAKSDSEVFTKFGTVQPYFGAIPERSPVDAFAVDNIFDTPAPPVESVPTQPVTPPAPASPSETIQQYPDSPFGNVDLDLSDMREPEPAPEPVAPKKKRKEPRVKKEKPPRVKKEKPAKKERVRKRRRPLPKLPIAIAAGCLVLILVGVFAIPPLVRSLSAPQAQPAPTDVVMGEKAEVPGYGGEKYTIDIPSSAATTASDRGIVVVNGTFITIYDPQDGSELFSEDAKEKVTFTIDTMVESTPALVWRAGDTLRVHFEGEMGSPKTVKIPPKSSVSSAGQQLLIAGEDGSYSTLDKNGVVPINVPSEAGTVMAVDEAGVVTAGFNTPVVTYSVSGKKQSEVELEPPSRHVKMARWVTAGNGRAVVVWSTSPSSKAGSQPVVVAVHSLEDGRVTGQASTTQSVTAESKWIRGQGRKRAVYGPFAFSMSEGSLVADGTTAGVRFDDAFGSLLTGQSPDGYAIVDGVTAHPSSSSLIGVVNDGSTAVVRTDQTHVTAFSKE